MVPTSVGIKEEIFLWVLAPVVTGLVFTEGFYLSEWVSQEGRGVNF
jgi:hypothetical protein